MKPTIKRFILWTTGFVVASCAVVVVLNFDLIRRVAFGGLKIHENTTPMLPTTLPRPAVLVFSKTNGFRHDEAIPAANSMFRQIARERKWGFFQTENGATFDPAILGRFDAVIFNNVSGDIFTAEQRSSLRSFVEAGGGFVGIHGAGGDPSYDWKWYAEDLIGAQFSGHPMNPQFQKAVVRVEDNSHPATKDVPLKWVRTDEWYSFVSSPRKTGYHILASLDEATYSPKGLFGGDLRMGEDHPVMWWHCVGKGKVLYSALGHRAEAYAERLYRSALANAVEWALPQNTSECSALAPKEAH
jgi:uncharacterized protein